VPEPEPEQEPEGPPQTQQVKPFSMADFEWVVLPTTSPDPDRSEPKRTLRSRVVPDVALTLLVGLAVLTAALLTAAFWPSEPPPTPPRAVVELPAGLPSIGSYVETRVLADGSLRVSHWVRSPEPVTALSVRVPYVGELDGSLEASEVTVVADGAPRILDAGLSIVTAAGPQTYYFPPADVVHVTYLLTGVLERSPSVPGRALARMTSLSLDYRFERGPHRVRVVGAKILTMACNSVGPVLVPERPCGAPVGAGWEVVLRGSQRDDRVVAQLNLT